MNTKEQKELAISKLLLLGLAFVGLGIVIWLAWLRPAPQLSNTEGAASSDAQTKQTQQTSDTPAAAKQLPPPKEDQGNLAYLVVTDWGVRLKLGSIIPDAYYVPSPDNPDRHIYLSVRSLQEADECAADKVSLGALSRFKAADTDSVSGRPMAQLHPNAKKVGEYYYYYGRPQAGCSENTAVLEKAGKAMDGLKQATTTAESLPESPPPLP